MADPTPESVFVNYMAKSTPMGIEHAMRMLATPGVRGALEAVAAMNIAPVDPVTTGNTSPGTGGTWSDRYWQSVATKLRRQLEQERSDRSWEDHNRMVEAQIRRDREIGEMGGGG